ncbi:putative ribonuclease H-like domain-containing protein [Tanacetum coccineum]
MYAAIKTRFRGNEASKKTQKALLKQHEKFNALSSKSLDSIFNRLQKLVSLLVILGVIITQEDLNSKFLRSLPPEWNTHVVIWMNKANIETMSIDDLYNNFKIFEQEVKKSVGASTGTQYMAFMTTPSTSSTNEVNTANSAWKVSTVNPNVNTASSSLNLEQIHEDDLEAMDLKWKLSLLSMRAKRYFQRTGKKIFINANDTVDKSKFICKYYKRGLATVEEQLVTFRKNEVLFSEEIGVLKREVACKDYELGVLKTEFEKVKQEKEDIDFKIAKFGNASKDLDKLLDLSYSGLDEFKEPEFQGYGPRDTLLKSNFVSEENTDNSLVKEQVSVDRITPVSVDKKALLRQATNDDKGFVDSGCSRHMTGNIAYLLNFKEFDGGYVTFRGGAYGGRITSKRQFNLSCYKATSDESMLWHRRLGHINFKNINKLVKENLVRGLPLKLFENDQTCVACLKGKATQSLL